MLSRAHLYQPCEQSGEQAGTKHQVIGNKKKRSFLLYLVIERWESKKAKQCSGIPNMSQRVEFCSEISTTTENKNYFSIWALLYIIITIFILSAYGLLGNSPLVTSCFRRNRVNLWTRIVISNAHNISENHEKKKFLFLSSIFNNTVILIEHQARILDWNYYFYNVVLMSDMPNFVFCIFLMPAIANANVWPFSIWSCTNMCMLNQTDYI